MMKRLVIGVVLLSAGILGGCSDSSVPSAAQQSEASVEARIKPVGEVAMALPSPLPPANGISSSPVVTPTAPTP
ncbi:hypothetical protein [Ferrovum myxofaciens]|jgi:hypothetical protein|uniref:hypothetical protein n=1 Tax=Ferrovum myxofaciens TaxID=416213 RepID=UPI0004E1785B|nr:hypothetical protein [Ferrovum myxofaciens]